MMEETRASETLVSYHMTTRSHNHCIFIPVNTSHLDLNAKGYKLMSRILNTNRGLALFRHPPVTGAYGSALLTPFQMNVWTSCAGMWLVVILTIRFVSWVETRTFDFVATSHVEETVRSWSDSLMIIIGAISEQGA